MRARGQKTRQGAASAVRNRHDRRHRDQLLETHELFDADKRPGEKCGLGVVIPAVAGTRVRGGTRGTKCGVGRRRERGPLARMPRHQARLPRGLRAGAALVRRPGRIDEGGGLLDRPNRVGLKSHANLPTIRDGPVSGSLFNIIHMSEAACEPRERGPLAHIPGSRAWRRGCGPAARAPGDDQRHPLFHARPRTGAPGWKLALDKSHPCSSPLRSVLSRFSRLSVSLGGPAGGRTG